MWDSIDSLCHDASTTGSTRSFSRVGATLAAVRTKGHTSKSRWTPASYTGEHNFELEFRKVYAARELICRVVGAERPGGGLANDLKTDSLNHAIDSDESRRRVKTAEIHSDTTHGRRGTVRVQPRTPDSKKKQRSSSTVSSQLQFHVEVCTAESKGEVSHRAQKMTTWRSPFCQVAIVRRSCGSMLPVCRTTCGTQSVHPVPLSIKN